MLVLKGFLVHSTLVNNTPNTINPVGELSSQSMTYAREKGFYTHSSAPNITLVSFTAKNNSTSVALASNFAQHVLTVAKAVFDYSFAANGEIFADELQTSLMTTFVGSTADFALGPIVNDGTRWVPEWVSWRSVGLSGITDNSIKVWLADAAFRGQYDDYEIVVVPPLTNLNAFFGTYSSVVTALGAVTRPQQTARVNTAKGNFPFTSIRTEEYEFINQGSPSQKIKTPWDLLIYGPAGNNVDSIKDAIVEHVLANSSHTLNEWMPLIPDLFRRTEFILIPFWDQYAIPNQTTQEGIYSPDLKPSRAIALMKSMLSYQDAHIDSHMTVLAHPYKSIMLGVIGGPENKDNVFALREIFSDIIAVPTSSLEYARMSQPTKTFLNHLAQMLVTAENMTAFTSLPEGYTRVTRDGRLYIVVSLNNINYLVAARQGFTVVIGNIED